MTEAEEDGSKPSPLPSPSPSPLHNFSLPYLKWGNQRLLRCVKLTPNHNTKNNNQSHSIPNNTIHNPFQQTQNLITFNNNNAHVAASNRLVKLSPFLNNNNHHHHHHHQDDDTITNKANVNGNANDASSSRPWNLRTRRAAFKAPLKIQHKRNINIVNATFDSSLKINSPTTTNFITPPPSVSASPSVKDKVKFSVSLSREEIEQDFFHIARIRPPRRPKKRPRIVQKCLDCIFPGLWLSEITPDSYKVAPVPES